MNDLIDSTELSLTQPAVSVSGLYLVSTPIGNLRDITLRALDVLAAADAILCEDSRVTSRLLQAYNLKKKLVVYNDHSDDGDRARVVNRLESGETLALVTDAGTPLLSDPGYKLVHACMSKGVPIIPVPGASALLPALQLGALPTDRFLFAGFLPHKASARQAMFSELQAVPATLVFYESPNRLHDAIVDALAVLGDRPVAIARELTKIHEEARHGTLAAWAADESLLGVMKGELVLMIAAPVVGVVTPDAIKAALLRALETLSVKDAAAEVSQAYGVPKKTAYDMALRLKHGQTE